MSKLETCLGSMDLHEQNENLVKIAVERGDRIRDLEADNAAQLDHIKRLESYIKRIEKPKRKRVGC